MNRRGFLSNMALGLLAAPLAAEGQQAGKVPRIALVFANTPAAEITGAQPKSPYLRAFPIGFPPSSGT